MRLARLMIAHLAANAAILGAGYWWLGIPESRNSTVAWSAIVALLLIVSAAVTYGAAFAFFGLGGEKPVRLAWKIAGGNVLPLGAVALAGAAVYLLLGLWQDYSSNPAFTLASLLTMTFRTPVAPGSVLRIFDAALGVIRWALLPALLLPMLASIAIRGWSGFAGAAGNLRRWWYWLVTPALLLCGLWLPLEILSWKPHMGNFAFEMFSLAVRASLAYLLFGAAWLALALATSAGKPRFTQSNTAASP